MLKMLVSPVAQGYYEFQWKTQRSITYMSVYVVAMLISLVLTSFGIRISLMIRVYHPNLKRIYCSALALWITLFISKMCTFLFQIRGYNFTSTHVDKESSGYIVLQISVFVRYFYFFCGSALPLTASVERGFATFFLKDYEKTSRPSIFIAIFSTNILLGLIFAIMVVFFDLTLIPVLVIPFLNILLCFILLNILYRYNIIRIRRLNKYHRDTQYTLSKRYQLRENIRILTLLMKMIYAALMFIVFIGVGLTLPAFMKIDGIITEPLRSFTEFCFNCSPIFVIPATAAFIPEFRRTARATLFQTVQLESRDSRNQSAYYKKSNEADVYFDQFKKSMTKGEREYPVAFIKRHT